MKRTEALLIILALVGAALSAYAIPLHYKDGGSICDINETLSCDAVNKSPWSTLFGIPVAVFGFIAYLLVALLVLKRRTVSDVLAFTEKDFWQYVFVFVLVMLGFQGYLTYIEVAKIGAYCIVCLGSQAIVLALALATGWLWRSS